VTGADLGQIYAINTTTAANSIIVDEGLGFAPRGIVVVGSNLLVANGTTNTVSEYTTAGSAVNISFITGLSVPFGLAVNGNNLFVANYGNGEDGTGTVSEYNATTGALINASFITGLSGPYGIALANVGVDHFAVSTASTATAGSAFSFTVTAQDINNNTVTSYTGIVQFTSTDGLAVLPANSTLTDGTGTFSATLNTVGTQTITATDTGTASITGTSDPIVVSAPVASTATHFSVGSRSVATAGAPASVEVTALDASNNTVTSYAGTVQFTSTDGLAILPANSTLTNGIGGFLVTFGTVGPQTVTATDTVTPSITGTSGAITVSAGAATHFMVSAPSTATAATPFSVTVTAEDSLGNLATGYAGIVHFTSTDPAYRLPADSTLTNGTGTFSVTLNTVGSQTVTATDTVTSSITGTSGNITVGGLGGSGAATHFVVSAPSTATAATPFSVTVTAEDSLGNLATGYAGIVHFTSTDPAYRLPADSTLTNGTGTFSVTLNTVGSQTVTATDTVTSSITGTSGNITVGGLGGSGAATHFVVSAPSTATAATPFSVTV